MSSPLHPRGVIDTSVVIDLDGIPVELLPEDLVISAVTLAELAAGPSATNNPDERVRRLLQLRQAEETFPTLPFDGAAAQAYAKVYAATRSVGRATRGRRAMDLLIAATALSNNLPLYTRNPDDFKGLQDLLEVVAVDDLTLDGPAAEPSE